MPSKERLIAALRLIDDITANAQSLDPKRDWEQSHDAVCQAYEIAHAAFNPSCMKAHPLWGKPIDVVVKEMRKERKNG